MLDTNIGFTKEVTTTTQQDLAERNVTDNNIPHTANVVKLRYGVYHLLNSLKIRIINELVT